jgi:hypothetical protein
VENKSAAAPTMRMKQGVVQLRRERGTPVAVEPSSLHQLRAGAVFSCRLVHKEVSHTKFASGHRNAGHDPSSLCWKTGTGTQIPGHPIPATMRMKLGVEQLMRKRGQPVERLEPSSLHQPVYACHDCQGTKWRLFCMQKRENFSVASHAI